MRNILLILGVFASAISLAQDSDTTSYVFNSTYVAKIEKAEKISDNPEVVDTIKTETDIKYEVVTRHVNTEFKPKTIPPVKLTLNPTRKKLQKHHASIGFGANGFPKFSYGYNSGRNADQAFGIMVNHHSAKTSIEGYDRNNAFMKNDLDLVYKKFVSHYVFTGDLNYSYNFFNLYGVSNEMAADSGFFVHNENQAYALGKINLAYHTGFKDSSALNHYGSLSYQNLYDKARNMEHGGFANAGITKYLEKGLLDVNLNAQFYINRDSTTYNSFGSVFNLTPTHKWKKEKFEFMLGFVLSGDLSDAGAKVNVAPRVKGQYSIVDELLNIYVDVNGGHSRWSYARLSQINPFMNPLLDFQNSRTVYNARTGFRGSLSKTMTFNLGLRIQDVKNQAMFVSVNGLGAENRFLVVYDNVKQTQFYGELTHEGKKWINVLQGEYNVFSAESQDAVWHMPEYKFVWNTKYNVQDLLSIGMDAYVIGSRQAKTYIFDAGSETTELSPFFDLNLSVDYNYSDNLVAFVKGYNLLNKNYMYWNNYPVQGINFLIGAKYRF